MAAEKPKSKQDPTGSFTVDHEFTGTVEVPSITKLLNRKAFKSQLSSRPKEASEKEGHAPPAGRVRSGFDEPTVSVSQTFTNLFRKGREEAAARAREEAKPPAPPQPQVAPPRAPGFVATQPAQPSSAETGTPTVKPAAARGGRRQNIHPVQLHLWKRESLNHSEDPLAQSLAILLGNGATAALFLSIHAPPPGSPVPLFVGNAAISPEHRRALWTGLCWNPMVSPELWNQFVKEGRVELPPSPAPGRGGHSSSVVRTAFGVEPDRWLTLVRVGPATACRGVLAILSDASLQSPLAQVAPLLATLPPSTSAKAA